MTQGFTNQKKLGKYLGKCEDECISGGVKNGVTKSDETWGLKPPYSWMLARSEFLERDGKVQIICDY